MMQYIFSIKHLKSNAAKSLCSININYRQLFRDVGIVATGVCWLFSGLYLKSEWRLPWK